MTKSELQKQIDEIKMVINQMQDIILVLANQVHEMAKIQQHEISKEL